MRVTVDPMSLSAAELPDLAEMHRYPMLEDLQGVDPRQKLISEALNNSGARRSTLLIVLVHAFALGLGAAISAIVAHSVSFVIAFLCAGSVLLSTSTTGRFRTRMVPDFVGQLSRVAGSVAAGAALPFMAVALFDASRTNFRAFAGLVLMLFLMSLAADWTSAWTIRRMWARGRLRSRAVMIGSGRLANELAVELRLRQEYGVDLVDVIEPTQGDSLAEELIDRLANSRSDRLIVAPLEDESGDGASLVYAVRRALSYGVPTFVVPRLYEMGLGLDSMSPDRARGYPLVRVQRSAHPTIGLKAKRMIDVIVSSAVLLATLPISLVLAFLVQVTSPGPVLFRQLRVGQNGQVFEMLKFRSMAASDNEHTERSSEHRITRVGRFLRATSLDELPQFWNVFNGDMTLVGPRPERVPFVEEGLRLYPGYFERHRMPMGLTGLAQVAGLRGEDTSVVERVKFDNLYVDQWSIALDLQIMAKTAFAILLQTKYRLRERELAAAITQIPHNAELREVVDAANLAARPSATES